ncbi:MAG: hypothetical protein WB460_18945 [Candidatus Acidiferrales bacterium]
MGLDAVVYRSKSNLQLGSDEQLAHLVPDTGEIYFDDDAASRRHSQELEAIHVRFGNIAMISELREEIARIVGADSILYQKIVYSGSHSGDFIPVDELARLAEEIPFVRKSGKPSRDLRDLVDRVEELTQAALHERNPIVFV